MNLVKMNKIYIFDCGTFFSVFKYIIVYNEQQSSISSLKYKTVN